MDKKTSLDVAKDALRRGDFKSGTLAALISIAESMHEIKLTQDAAEQTLERIANILTLSVRT